MAHCKPKDTKVAVKLTDLEKFQGNTALVCIQPASSWAYTI